MYLHQQSAPKIGFGLEKMETFAAPVEECLGSPLGAGVGQLSLFALKGSVILSLRTVTLCLEHLNRVFLRVSIDLSIRLVPKTWRSIEDPGVLVCPENRYDVLSSDDFSGTVKSWVKLKVEVRIRSAQGPFSGSDWRLAARFSESVIWGGGRGNDRGYMGEIAA